MPLGFRGFLRGLSDGRKSGVKDCTEEGGTWSCKGALSYTEGHEGDHETHDYKAFKDQKILEESHTGSVALMWLSKSLRMLMNGVAPIPRPTRSSTSYFK